MQWPVAAGQQWAVTFAAVVAAVAAGCTDMLSVPIGCTPHLFCTLESGLLPLSQRTVEGVVAGTRAAAVVVEVAGKIV